MTRPYFSAFIRISIAVVLAVCAMSVVLMVVETKAFDETVAEATERRDGDKALRDDESEVKKVLELLREHQRSLESRSTTLAICVLLSMLLVGVLAHPGPRNRLAEEERDQLARERLKFQKRHAGLEAEIARRVELVRGQILAAVQERQSTLDAAAAEQKQLSLSLKAEREALAKDRAKFATEKAESARDESQRKSALDAREAELKEMNAFVEEGISRLESALGLESRLVELVSRLDGLLAMPATTEAARQAVSDSPDLIAALARHREGEIPAKL